MALPSSLSRLDGIEGPSAAPAGDESIGGADTEEPAADQVGAANWNFRISFPEGALDEDAIARIRIAKGSIKPVAAAFKRHGASIVRSDEAMRRALARSYGLADALKDQPAVVNAVLEERRIKITKPVRENVFLAVLKLACPETAADTISRWAGALAFAAASGCFAKDLPAFLRTTGIRQAADRWVEIRRAAKPTSSKPAAQKLDPIDKLRAMSLGTSLPDTLPLPSDNPGLFLLVVERTDEGTVAHGASNDPALVSNAIKRILRP